MEHIRLGKSIPTRASRFHEWNAKQYESISQAKRANGLNSRAPDKAPKCENRRHTERRQRAMYFFEGFADLRIAVRRAA